MVMTGMQEAAITIATNTREVAYAPCGMGRAAVAGIAGVCRRRPGAEKRRHRKRKGYVATLRGGACAGCAGHRRRSLRRDHGNALIREPRAAGQSQILSSERNDTGADAATHQELRRGEPPR